MPITLKRLVVVKGSLVYDDRGRRIHVQVGDIDQEASVSIDKLLTNVASSGVLTLSGISMNMQGTEAPLAGQTLTVSHDLSADLRTGSLTVRRIEVSLGQMLLAMQGRTLDILTPAPDLDLTVASDTIAVRDLLAVLPPATLPIASKLTASGAITLTAALKGPARAEGAALHRRHGLRKECRTKRRRPSAARDRA